MSPWKRPNRQIIRKILKKEIKMWDFEVAEDVNALMNTWMKNWCKIK